MVNTQYRAIKREALSNGVLPSWAVNLGLEKAIQFVEAKGCFCAKCKTTERLTIHHKDGRGWSRKSRERGLSPNNDRGSLSGAEFVVSKRKETSLE